MRAVVRGSLVVMAALALLAVGFGSAPATSQGRDTKDKGKGDHSGWWCAEHGIPEDECSMCGNPVAKKCKEQGDWCKEHDRALSQCFYHKPERRAFYAAKYKAKHGKEPPAIPEFDDKKNYK